MADLPIFTTLFKKVKGKLIIDNDTHLTLYKFFLDSLQEGQIVEVNFDARDSNRTLGQLGRIHKCLKALSNYTGYTVNELKLVVKKEAGLLTHITENESKFIDFKSFADCSFDELTLATEALFEIGDNLGINLR